MSVNCKSAWTFPEIVIISLLMLQVVFSENADDNIVQMENPKISWPDPNRDRDRRQVGLGSLSHDGSHGGDHGDGRDGTVSVSDGSRSSISSPSRNKDELAPRRRYPNRNYDQGSGYRNTNQFNDPSSAFRQQSRQTDSGGTFPYDPYGPSRGNSSSSARSRNVNQPNRNIPTTTKRPAQSKAIKKDNKKDPFADPDRYRVPQLEQAADNVRFVNGRPYR